MAREFARQFYKSKEWQTVREYVLKRDNYLCVKCGKPAEVVHHIVHLRPDNIYNIDISLRDNNLLSLCNECHFEEHKGEHGKGRQVREQAQVSNYYFDDDGYIKEIPPHSKNVGK